MKMNAYNPADDLNMGYVAVAVTDAFTVSGTTIRERLS
jgi:hypothetical protein